MPKNERYKKRRELERAHRNLEKGLDKLIRVYRHYKRYNREVILTSPIDFVNTAIELVGNILDGYYDVKIKRKVTLKGVL